MLYKLYCDIIKAGRKCYSAESKYDTSLNESNYLKKDSNYYSILKTDWEDLCEKIDSVFESKFN